VRGDRAIQGLAKLIIENVHELAGPEGFVGHVGGDDFIILIHPDLAHSVAGRICQRFDALVPSLYDPADVERGGVEVRDRQGNLRTFPLLTISIGVATTAHRTFSHYAEVVTVATEMKQYAKREPRSSFAVDRRTN
jgi:GGDEF domain-containing protein